jgi:hypothetical protein
MPLLSDHSVNSFLSFLKEQEGIGPKKRVKLGHPVKQLVGQLVVGDLPWSRATSKTGAHDCIAFLSAGGAFPEASNIVFPESRSHCLSSNLCVFFL